MTALIPHLPYLWYIFLIFSILNGWVVGFRAMGFSALYIVYFGDLPEGVSGILYMWALYGAIDLVYSVVTRRK